MIDDHPELTTEIPEADLLEQQAPLQPATPTDPDQAPPGQDSPGSTAAEADWLQQQAPVPTEDEDDYPPATPLSSP